MKIVGYLKKKKTKGFFKNLFKKTNLRYFECSFIEEYFGYKKSEKEEIFLNIFDFQDIKDVNDTIKEEDLKVSDWKHGMILQIKDSTYTLFAKEEEEKKNWLTAFRKVLKINRARPKQENDLVIESKKLKNVVAREKKNEKNEDNNLNPTISKEINYIKPKINLNLNNTQKANDKKMATKGNFKKFIMKLEENPSEAIVKSAKINDNTNLDNNLEKKDTSIKNKEGISLNLSLIKEDSNIDINFSVENEEIYSNEKFRKNETTGIYKKSISNPDDLNRFYMRDNTKGSKLNKKIEIGKTKDAPKPDPEQYSEEINLSNLIADKDDNNTKRVFDKNREEISQASTNIPDQQARELSEKKIKSDVKKILIDSIKIFTEGNSFVPKKSLKDLISNQQNSYGAIIPGNIFDALGATNAEIKIVNKKHEHKLKNPIDNQKEIISSNRPSDKEIYGNVDESVIKYFENYSKAAQFESNEDVTVISRQSGKTHIDSKVNSLKNVEKERVRQEAVNENESGIIFLKNFEEEKKKRTENILNNGINFDDENRFVQNKMKKRSEITKVADEIRSNPMYYKVEKKVEKISENNPEHISMDFKVKQAYDIEVRHEFLEDW